MRRSFPGMPLVLPALAATHRRLLPRPEVGASSQDLRRRGRVSVEQGP